MMQYIKVYRFNPFYWLDSGYKSIWSYPKQPKSYNHSKGFWKQFANPVLSKRVFPTFTDLYPKNPSGLQGDLWDVPTFILLKLAHLIPKCEAKSSSTHRRRANTASLGCWNGAFTKWTRIQIHWETRHKERSPNTLSWKWSQIIEVYINVPFKNIFNQETQTQTGG